VSDHNGAGHVFFNPDRLADGLLAFTFFGGWNHHRVLVIDFFNDSLTDLAGAGLFDPLGDAYVNSSLSVTISGTQTVRLTTSQVPAGSQGAAQGVAQGLQGAEQQRLVFLPKQPPASADADTAMASAMERTNRIL
jgi:hypothetical protein